MEHKNETVSKNFIIPVKTHHAFTRKKVTTKNELSLKQKLVRVCKEYVVNDSSTSVCHTSYQIVNVLLNLLPLLLHGIKQQMCSKKLKSGDFSCKMRTCTVIHKHKIFPYFCSRWANNWFQNMVLLFIGNWKSFNRNEIR